MKEQLLEILEITDEFLKKTLWIQTYSNYASNPNCINPHQAEIFANDALKAYEKKFKPKATK